MIMRFLGGPLDMTTREVRESMPHTQPGVPPLHYVNGGLVYRRRHVIAKQRWFVYILSGHTPTREQILDTAPREAPCH